MLVYYAHPISTYNTVREESDISLLTKLGFSVYNPNNSEASEGYQREGMSYFTHIIKEECQALAFRSFSDGKIPAGVYTEVTIAYYLNIPVIELPTIISVDSRSLSVEETRERLNQLMPERNLNESLFK